MKYFVCGGLGSGVVYHKDRIPEGRPSSFYINDHVKCLFCKGDGIIPTGDPRYPACEAYIKIEEKIAAKHKKESDAHQAKQNKLKQSGLSKLTKDEKAALGIKE